MGCGASTAPYVPAKAEEPASHAPASGHRPVPASHEPQGVVVAENPQPPRPAKGGSAASKRQRGPFLPFIRFDKTAVPKELFAGDEVYVYFTYFGSVLALSDQGAAAEMKEPSPEFSFAVERVAGAGPLNDGDQVRLRSTATGLYLEAPSDHEPLTGAALDAREAAQIFRLFKQGRPLQVKHRDTMYLQTHLSNYVEVQQDVEAERGVVAARRWRRGEPQTLTVLKRSVVESTTTELARKMQFQAFDLDGNKSISRGEMEYMLRQVKGDISEEELNEVMGACDPAQTGNIPYNAFAAWADGGGLSEELLQHAEVLGNMAQRCNDCLYEENAFIEVLTTVHSGVCQEVAQLHSDKFGSNLAQAIDAKASEQDGFIFSNYWKLAMRALVESEVDLWTRSLNDAMRGLGTDEDSLTALVCTMPERLRVPIFERYLERYGQGLLEHIESETSFSYKKVLVFQAMSPEDCRARILNEAMVGLGTSEDQLIRVICQCDLGERRQVKEAYMRMYQRDLVDHVRSETSGDFQKALLCMLEAEEAPFDLDADCAAMKAAMDGWGTEEAALIRLICAKTPKQMEDVNKRFAELYGKSLLDRVKSETSGNFQATLLGCIRHPMEQLAHSVRYCLEGWGTDDRGLITLLVHLPDFKKDALIRQYSATFHRDLLNDIKADTSGSYEKALCALVRPAPFIWAEALKGAMKGLGTNDELLINFLVIAKDEMAEVRKAFEAAYGESLADWIDGDCSGDYKKTLLSLVERNSEDHIDMVPLYWTQRCRDAVGNVDTLKDVLTRLPAVAIKRGTEVFQTVYGKSLRQEIEKKCNEKSSFFSFSNYWKTTMLALLDLPVERYVKGLNDAMRGWGTDEFTLTALVCTMPENLYDDIHQLYRERYGKSLVDHIESETSFSYKKALVYQALSWPQSRAKALNSAMVGMGTSEKQLIRVIVLSTMQQRVKIREAYQAMYGRDLINHIESETSGSFKAILVGILESTSPQVRPDFDGDCETLKQAMEGMGTDEDALIRILAGKTPEQIEQLKAKFEERYGRSLFDWVNDETWDWGASIFIGTDFREAILCLLRPPREQLAYSVRDCIVGFGTDDTGLITCLVHLSERRRKELVETYKEIQFGGDLYRHIKGDTMGSYEGALLALAKPAPMVWAEAITSSMKGLGTSDELLINWMCIAKDRMDEVREAFLELHGKTLAWWIDGDCSGDYKDTLIRLANRECYRFVGNDTGLTIQAPPSREEGVRRFNRTFNELCRKKKKDPHAVLVPPEEAQQEMGCVFLYFAGLSSCAPDLDKPGLWELTNAVGFPPADDGPDLEATFNEWNYSGTGCITWNDFVREMATRINDPNHYEADPLPED